MMRLCISRVQEPRLWVQKACLSFSSVDYPYLRSASFSTDRGGLEGLSHTDAYYKTTPNLKIGSHTRVIFQGFTGRQVRVPQSLRAAG